MNEDLANWSTQLLFTSTSVLLGMAGLVAARSSADRTMAFGLQLQGILLTLVVAATHFHRSAELRLGAFSVAGLLLIFSLTSPKNSSHEQPATEDHSS